MFSSLLVLTTVPRLRPLLSVSLLARIHVSGMPIALSFLVVTWTGSYTAAGFVIGGMAVGQAVAGPVRGRVADRSSASRLLIATGCGFAVVLAALVLASVLLPADAWPAAVVIAVVAGLMLPPVSQVSRAVWPRLAEGNARESLFTLESTGYELVAMGGPLLAAGTVALIDARAAVGLLAVLAAAGALGFGLLLRRTGLDTQPPPDGAARAEAAADETAPRPGRSMLRDPVFVRALLVPFFMMAALFSVNLSVVALGETRGSPGLSGVLIALWSVGSLIGGTVVASRGRRPNASLRIGGLAVGIGVLALLLPPAAAATPTWLLIVVITVGGTAISPSLAAGNSRIAVVAPTERRAEAFGWLATATTVSVSAMVAVTGGLLDHTGPAVPVAIGAVLAAVAALLALRSPRRDRSGIRSPAATTGR